MPGVLGNEAIRPDWLSHFENDRSLFSKLIVNWARGVVGWPGDGWRGYKDTYTQHSVISMHRLYIFILRILCIKIHIRSTLLFLGIGHTYLY